MKINKVLFWVMFLLAVLFVVPVAFAQDTTPPRVEDFSLVAQFIIGLVTIVVTFGIKHAAKEWGIDFSGKITQLVATIVGLIFETSDSLLALIPPQYYGIAVAVFGVITSVLLAFGGASLLKRAIPSLSAPKK